MSTIISTQNLSRRFGNRWAYARIDLELQEGERLLLIGANGSGKTTLLRSLATLLPQTLGTMEIFGRDPNKAKDLIRSKIGWLSHRTGLYEDLSAVDNLQIFASLFGKKRTKKQIEKLVEEVGLELSEKPVKAYSAGMRKRASVALLRLKEPELILLDEPFSALDPQGIDDISSLFESMSATQIIVSHQVERASKLCSRCILLEEGLIRWQGMANKAWDAWRAAQQVSG